MPSLISGLAGSSWSRSSGLAASSQISKSDVQAVALQVRPKSLGPRVGKFRRAFSGITKDSTGAPLAACDVHLFKTSNDLELDQQISDAAGVYELSAYLEGPFYAVAYKTGAPHVTGATVNTLIGD